MRTLQPDCRVIVVTEPIDADREEEVFVSHYDKGRITAFVADFKLLLIYNESILTSIGCDKCHTPELKTGEFPVEALSNKSFFPYSDFLLHDMGDELNDGYTEGSALTSE